MKKEQKPSNNVQINCFLPEEYASYIKKCAKRNHVSVSTFVKIWLLKIIDQERKGNNAK